MRIFAKTFLIVAAAAVASPLSAAYEQCSVAKDRLTTGYVVDYWDTVLKKWKWHWCKDEDKANKWAKTYCTGYSGSGKEPNGGGLGVENENPLTPRP